MFLEVLRWGNRYKLAILEKNGRYFHWFIDRYFKEAPFLRLNLELFPRYLLLYFSNIKFRIYDHCDFPPSPPIFRRFSGIPLLLFAALCLRIFTPELSQKIAFFMEA